MEITLEEIQKKFETLPEDLKWAIMAANVDDNIIDIGKIEGLNVDQMGQLSLETNMVMFGFTPVEKFEESVKASLGLPEEKIKSIVKDVNEKILKNIREKLINLTTPQTEEVVKFPETHPEDLEELKAHGIEIIPQKLELNASEEHDAAQIHKILSQKLSGSVQTPVAKSDHSLENITKQPSTTPVPKAPTPPPAAGMGTIKPNSMDSAKLSPSYGKGMDPYRIKPE